MANVLTSLQNVKSWCKVTTSDDDMLITRLIAQASRSIYGYLTTNTLFLQTFSDSYDGVNNTRLILNEWPVVSVASLYVDGANILPAPTQPLQGAGYRLEAYNGVPPGQPQAIDLFGNRFWKGSQNVYVTYSAGYSISNEAQTVPASAPYSVTVNQIYGSWGQDDGVTTSAGVALVKVSSNPSTGQYCVDGTSGTYTFAAADASDGMLISYSYIPADIEQACIEIASERYRYRDRIGFQAKSLGGQETASYQLVDMSDYVKMLLQPYKRTNVL